MRQQGAGKLGLTAAALLVLGTPGTAHAESDPVMITVRAAAVSPAGHPLTVSIEAASTDPGATVSVSGSGYVKPAGDDGSVVTIRVVGPDGVALRPGSGRVPLRNPESGALLESGLGDWAVVKADPSGVFRTTLRLPNGRDSVPRLDPDATYSLQVITGTAGANDLVSSVGSASDTGDTRLVPGRSDPAVEAVEATSGAAAVPPQPGWRRQLIPAAALLGAAGIAVVLAKRRPRSESRG